MAVNHFHCVKHFAIHVLCMIRDPRVTNNAVRVYVCVFLFTVDLVFMLCCKLRMIIVVTVFMLTSFDVCFTGAFGFVRMAQKSDVTKNNLFI